MLDFLVWFKYIKYCGLTELISSTSYLNKVDINWGILAEKILPSEGKYIILYNFYGIIVQTSCLGE